MNRWFRAVTAFVLVLVFATGAAAAGVIAGPARVIDGNTIVVDDVHLRIFGIDAPESRQTCVASDGHDYFCGRVAASALAEKIAGRPVTCRPRTTDRYGRTVAVCFRCRRRGPRRLAGARRPGDRLPQVLDRLRRRRGHCPACPPRPVGRRAIAVARGTCTRAMSGWRPARLAEIECTQRDLNEVHRPIREGDRPPDEAAGARCAQNLRLLCW